jgi:hypothetical protein
VRVRLGGEGPIHYLGIQILYRILESNIGVEYWSRILESNIGVEYWNQTWGVTPFLMGWGWGLGSRGGGGRDGRIPFFLGGGHF